MGKAVLALALFIATGRAVAPQAKQEAPPELEHGIALLSAGQLDAALNAFARYKQSAPRDARAYFYSGMALVQSGRLDDAASELALAVGFDPGPPEYRILQANVLARLEQNDEASKLLADFRQPDSFRQLSPVWQKLLADTFYRLAEGGDAIRVLDVVGAELPNDPDVDLNRGQAYVVLGKTDLALQAFESSIRKSRRNPLAYFEAGKILYQKNDLAAAKTALVNAVEQDPKPEYLLKLADVCLARHEVNEALKYLDRAQPAASTFPEIYNALGRAYDRRGDRALGDEYRQKFARATEIERQKQDRLRSAGKFLAQGERQLDAGDGAAARSLFEQAAEADPNRWAPHAYLAEMLLKSGKPDLAYPHLVKMDSIDPGSVVGNYLFATYWYGQKNYERARPYAERAELSRPSNSELRHLLGDIYRHLGERQKALKEFRAAAQLAPNRADFQEDVLSTEKR